MFTRHKIAIKSNERAKISIWWFVENGRFCFCGLCGNIIKFYCFIALNDVNMAINWKRFPPFASQRKKCRDFFFFCFLLSNEAVVKFDSNRITMNHFKIDDVIVQTASILAPPVVQTYKHIFESVRARERKRLREKSHIDFQVESSNNRPTDVRMSFGLASNFRSC